MKYNMVCLSTIIFVILLRWLNPSWALLISFAVLLFNMFYLSAMCPNLFKDDEKPFQNGLLFYPILMCILLILFGTKIYIVAGTFAILVLGDNLASITGREFKGLPLPWNNSKTWIGSTVFILAAFVGAFFIMKWVEPSLSLKYVTVASILGALACAFVESVNLKIKDDILITAAGAIVLLFLSEMSLSKLGTTLSNQWGSFGGIVTLLLLIFIHLVITFYAYYKNFVTLDGFLCGLIMGIVFLFFASLKGYLIPLIFFVFGTKATLYNYEKKSEAGLAQESEGARGFKHAFGNGLLGTLFMLLAVTSPNSEVFFLGMVAAFAAALADTTASELGQVYGNNPVLATTLQSASVGDKGAVSIEGTICGLIAALAIAFAAWILGLVNHYCIPIIVIAAFAGMYGESYLNAWAGEREFTINNEISNLIATGISAIFAIILYAIQV